MTNLNDTILSYETLVRENLKVKNPALLKTGVLGTLINILSHIKYDAALYYQKLLRELNPATAEDFNSLLFHSAILDYTINYATPAKATINIVVPETNVRVAETLTYNLDRDTVLIDANGLYYQLEEDIKIYVTNSTLSAKRISSDGTSGLEINKIPNPLKTSENIYLIEYPDLKQYKREFHLVSVPDYDIGVDINQVINIDSYKNIYEINVYLQDTTNYNIITEDSLRIRNSHDIMNVYKLSQLQVKYNKFNASQFDEDIYLNIQNNQLVFAYGNGINGKKLTVGQKLIFEIKTTAGALGNVNNIEIIAPNLLVVSEDQDGYKTTSRENLKILSSTGGQEGTSIDTIYNIRKNMVRQSNTRSSIVTLNDYQTSFMHNGYEPFVDMKYFNSKSNVFLYNTIRDANQKIIKTNTLVIKETDFTSSLFFPEYTYNGITMVSPFYYKQKFNHYIAYMVRPLIEVQLINNSDVDNYIVLNNNINLQVMYDYYERKTKIRVINNNSLYTYILKSNQVEMELSKNNNFEQTVNQRFLDKYCLFDNPLKEITVGIYDYNMNHVMDYYSNDIVYQLVEKQKHFTYTELNRLNPSVANRYVLNIPVIDNYYFKSTSGRNIFTQLDNFFNISDKKNLMAFDVEAHQSFFNTIDLPDKYRQYVIESNNNGDLLNSSNTIIIKTLIDKYAYSLSSISSVEELEFRIKTLVYGLLISKEGFSVDYYETELEKKIYDNMNIFKNIEVVSPKAFSIYNNKEIYDNMEKDLEASKIKVLDLVKYVPTYFHFDYDNINIVIDFV